MSRKLTPLGPFLIEPEEPMKCELCGELAETRPYGPDGKRVCWECAKKDMPGTVRRFRKFIGEPEN